MPELPEVETFARALRPLLAGCTILSADLRWARTLAAPSPRKFRAQIQGQKIVDVTRRAKYLTLQLTDFSLFVHLRMSGDLFIKEAGYKAEKHDRLILALTPGPSPDYGRGELNLLPAPSSAQVVAGDGDQSIKYLVFNDTRKFGRVWLTDDADSVVGGLGPEPLGDSFTPQWLYESLHARRRQMKPLLLDQTFLAGLGNIYTDEALHIAKIHPLSLSDSVTPKQAERLNEAIRAVLNEGIRRNGASIDWVYRGGEFQNYFRVYGRDGEACPECGTKIQKFYVGQRGTHVCPHCQKLKR